jgi:FeS assembly SUF system regulator
MAVGVGFRQGDFMRLSRLADYAVVLMTHIAQHPEQVHTAADVTMATRVPAPTVAKLLNGLGRSGLLASTRGIKGGYALARPATAIAVGEIVAVLEGPIALTQCIKKPGSCDIEAVCQSRLGLHRINLAVRKVLEEISLAEIAFPVPAPAAPPRSHRKRPGTPDFLIS